MKLVGTLVNFGGAALTLRVEYPHVEANPKYKPPKDKSTNQVYQMWKAYSDLQVQMQKAALARTPREAQQADRRRACEAGESEGRPEPKGLGGDPIAKRLGGTRSPKKERSDFL